VALVVAIPAVAATPTLTGTDGPGYTITLSPKPKRAGTYKLVVKDRAKDHNFHLFGPGVNVSTSVKGKGTKTFVVKLKAGKVYRFICDPHADSMKGSFKVPK
jgi:plastocyanin